MLGSHNMGIKVIAHAVLSHLKLKANNTKNSNGKLI